MTFYNKFSSLILTVITIVLAYSCANRAQGPTGGPKDTTPPKVSKSIPNNGALNFNKKTVQIDFDEQISLEKISENVIISPPQIKVPEVKSIGKRIMVEFSDDLKENTTYSINFGNAIADLNEKNILKNYQFAYSTGNEIDTLQISGTVINAEDLNPISGVYVGVYLENNDSAFFKKPFLRIGRTDNKGKFSISNLKKGTYKIYALGDTNQDFFYQPSEGLAMYDSLITPTFSRIEMHDTIWKDSTHVDSIRKYIGTSFEPNNITLRYFKEKKKRLYLVKSERKEAFNFSLFFNAPLNELPIIKPLNFDLEGKYLLQKNSTNDSLNYWITDSLTYKNDTLKMAVTYLKTDSTNQLAPFTDTLNLVSSKTLLQAKIKKNKKNLPTKMEALKFVSNAASPFEIYNPILLHFNAPLQNTELSKIHLSLKKDSTFKKISFKWKQIDSTKMNYSIDYKWVAEMTYKIQYDSAAFKSIYNKTNNCDSNQFKIRSLDEYSSIKMIPLPYDPKIVLQVLDAKDQVINTKPAKDKSTTFEYLKPGDYYIRMFMDINGNGKWDTGDLTLHKHPEEVFYYSKKISIKANWEFEETWNYNQTPLLKQKPKEIQKEATAKTKE